MTEQQPSSSHGEWKPVPDPTVLTTEALLREIAALRTLIDQRISATEQLFETKIQLGREGGMALKELVETKFGDLRELLNERYATQTKALDAAFLAQQAAVATSFDASEKAMAAALLAAKEAVEKANLANEKRFDSVNEFRAQLSDIITTLLPRNEAEVRFTALDARVTENKNNIALVSSTVAAETAAVSGRYKGSKENMAAMYALAGLLITLGLLGIGVLALVHR